MNLLNRNTNAAEWLLGGTESKKKTWTAVKMARGQATPAAATGACCTRRNVCGTSCPSVVPSARRRRELPRPPVPPVAPAVPLARHSGLRPLLRNFGIVAALTALSTLRGACAQANIGTVTCKVTADNFLDYFAVDGTSFTIDTTCGRDWNKICTFSFADNSMNAQVVSVSGEEEGILAAGAFCPAAGLALTCSSTYTASAWNKVKSDTSWKSYSAMTRLTGTSWAAASFDDSTWTAAATSTSRFSCASCGTNGAGEAFAKIWGWVIRERAFGCARHVCFVGVVVGDGIVLSCYCSREVRGGAAPPPTFSA